jgi:type IV pilus assembly protein PilB
MAKKLVGSLLKEKGLITERQLQKGLEEQARSGKLLGRILVEMGFVKEDEVLKVLGIQSNVEYINLKNILIPQEVMNKVPGSVAKIYNIVPVSLNNGTLVVAVADSLNVSVIDELRFTLNCDVKPVIAKQEEIEEAIAKYYGKDEESVQDILKALAEEVPAVAGLAGEEEAAPDVASLQEMAERAPIVRYLNAVLVQAIKDRASDIHFEPFENEFKVRYRVDGTLYEMVPPPKSLSLAITSRIKVISSLDIAERRLPQDGRVMLNIGQHSVDLRVSTLPTVFGESVVLRVLDRSVVSLSLDQIGFSKETLEKLRVIVDKPNGIILATGPTGCGKTTTLYSCLREINDLGSKVITTEDPVEYDIPGVIQVPIKPKINLTFAICLRHILRQDPDIIMVGEIRDTETAQMAIQASLTGHLVLSTLHTNDAPGTITRLIDMEIEPFLITSTLEGVIAQRLVRVICSDCKEAYKPDEKILKELDLRAEDVEGKIFYYGKGCDRCNNTGYRGRTAISELLIMTDELRSLIIERVQTGELRRVACQQGMRTLREDGIRKILDGITTVEEIIRETQAYK